MQQHRIRRLVVTSSIGVGDSAANMPGYVKVLQRTFLRGAQADKTKMEAAVIGSGLDWVIARPAVLTDEPATGATRSFSATTAARPAPSPAPTSQRSWSLSSRATTTSDRPSPSPTADRRCPSAG